jgi:hypothetical protein
MSAPVVAVTSLLVDVLSRMDGREDLSPAEAAFFDHFWPQVRDLISLQRQAMIEMQALAPALLAQGDAA